MKTFTEFISEAQVMPTWGELNKTPQQKQADAAKRDLNKKFGQARVMPTFAQLAKQRHAGMTEDEIVEFLGKFFGKKPAAPQKGRLNRPDAPVHHAPSHVASKVLSRQNYDADGIDPKDVPVFKPTWMHAGK